MSHAQGTMTAQGETSDALIIWHVMELVRDGARSKADEESVFSIYSQLEDTSPRSRMKNLRGGTEEEEDRDEEDEDQAEDDEEEAEERDGNEGGTVNNLAVAAAKRFVKYARKTVDDVVSVSIKDEDGETTR